MSNFASRSENIERNRRFIQSVSDIYGKDEIEELLDEIRHLEPGSLLTDDIQDFEIDGSRQLQNNGESTISMSVQSWDSHAVYRAQLENLNSPVQVFQGVVLQANWSQLFQKLELLRVLYLVCCLSSLICVYISDWTHLSSPLVFVLIFSLLTTATLIFIDVTGLIGFLPLPWAHINALLFFGESLALLVISSILNRFVGSLPHIMDISDVSLHNLYISSVLGLVASLLALIQSLWTSCGRPYPLHTAVPTHVEMPSPVSPVESSPKTPDSPTARPAMATMAALAGMSSAAIATAPRLGNRTLAKRNSSLARENIPMRPIVRNSVSWDDVKPSSARLKQQQLPPL